MRIGIVGLGMGGATLACLLADDGHDVTVVEQAEDPSPVGAGIWLQALGQQVLERLDLLQPLRAASRTVERVEIVTADGRSLVDLGYDALPGSTAALGVHRGDLFALLLQQVRRRGVPLRLGVPVTGVRPTVGGMTIETADGDLATYDLVVGCDGSRSRVRWSMGVTVRDRAYDYGALWAIVDDPAETATDTLFQCLGGTSTYLGVLPTGCGRTSLFWSVRQRDMAATLAAGLPAWRQSAAAYAGPHADLLDRVEVLLPATYRDVVVRTPYRLGAVLVGDSAHAMSPQLGTGTSLALADAWTLAHTLRTERDLESALAAYARHRAAHLRWYQWTTRMMMPVFQSDLAPLAWPRDALAPLVTRLPGVPGLLVGTLCGDRTTPWTTWRLPG
ncbi:NAD(P)/FAD-dependent oxidoreductase [Nocardioides sp.]|uniref:FAD-dependent oxidoreductase n=1 Tax=Nocardioides sp. TaxID=35761 RepID=UPI00272100CE|nr:NAD(P)/FAD-dependent oxidoreductase [Nocardioides sp.]MDO9454762.1 NAD(P)/FAD-dependent oxidoreductase [Nocardioides sp.]